MHVHTLPILPLQRLSKMLAALGWCMLLMVLFGVCG